MRVRLRRARTDAECDHGGRGAVPRVVNSADQVGRLEEGAAQQIMRVLNRSPARQKGGVRPAVSVNKPDINVSSELPR